jgi:hypothetical protein
VSQLTLGSVPGVNVPLAVEAHLAVCGVVRALLADHAYMLDARQPRAAHGASIVGTSLSEEGRQLRRSAASTVGAIVVHTAQTPWVVRSRRAGHAFATLAVFVQARECVCVSVRVRACAEELTCMGAELLPSG